MTHPMWQRRRSGKDGEPLGSYLLLGRQVLIESLGWWAVNWSPIDWSLESSSAIPLGTPNVVQDCLHRKTDSSRAAIRNCERPGRLLVSCAARMMASDIAAMMCSPNRLAHLTGRESTSRILKSFISFQFAIPVPRRQLEGKKVLEIHAGCDWSANWQVAWSCRRSTR